MIPLLYIYCMIPTNKEIDEVQMKNREIAEKENDIEGETPEGEKLI